MPDKYIIAFERPLKAAHIPMDKEVSLVLTMGDLVTIHDALSQATSKMNDKEFANIYCTIEAVEAAIVSNSQDKT
ncbi:hypothetical protein [Acinetobacter sp. NPDC052428]|uniref:hypothetical protein n=1 Tax=Acinetobacter sp. NPDC052428 TaxID=3363890 RepID=UPI0037CB813F